MKGKHFTAGCRRNAPSSPNVSLKQHPNPRWLGLLLYVPGENDECAEPLSVWDFTRQDLAEPGHAIIILRPQTQGEPPSVTDPHAFQHLVGRDYLTEISPET